MVRDGLLIFNSVHKTMRAEELCRREDLDVRVMPVPRQLSSDCGLSLAFPLGQRARVDEVLEAHGLVPARVHRQTETGYEPLD